MNRLKLIKRLWHAIPMSDHARWTITCAILEMALPFIKGGVVHNAYMREKEWQSKRISPFHGGRFPDLPTQSKPDIFLWGVIDWRLRFQRPQHLARGLAERGHRVFYISTLFVNDRKPGFELEQMDADGRLFNVRLHLKGRPLIYAAAPAPKHMERMKASITALLTWTGSRSIVSIVQHPYWHELARGLPDSRLVYDCLDHHDGFGNTGEEIAHLEKALVKNADLVIATSRNLYNTASADNANTVILRNATDYDFFAATPHDVFRDPEGRVIVGYYGAIAHWLDIDLLAEVARAFPECLLLLVGNDECGARQALAAFSNVIFTGEVKYGELPYYLYAMDVCLLPFKVIPLTLATNPVKVYEYLSAGKPVVAIDLPELHEFDGLVATAGSHAEFVSMVGAALASGRDADTDEAAARRAFASRHTWKNRVDTLIEHMCALPVPKISVVIVTYNNLPLTRACLDSVERFSDYSNMEVIVVDNNSTDGTPDFLRLWATGGTGRRIILNPDNRGFSAANNQGLAIAGGEYLVLLNNDTEVTVGWLHTLMAHLRKDPAIGMVGPVTNNIGNEARIRLRYSDSDDMRRKAAQYTLAHMGEELPIHSLAFFCVMIPRHVYEKVGPLDEIYGLGFFEDDDYCRRVQQAGLRLVCAEDVFIHHHLSASFGKLGKGRQELLDRNRKIYEEKWGPWIPHRHR